MRELDAMIPTIPLSSVMILNTKASGQTLCSNAETDTPKRRGLLSSPAHATFSPRGPFSARSISIMYFLEMELW